MSKEFKKNEIGELINENRLATEIYECLGKTVQPSYHKALAIEADLLLRGVYKSRNHLFVGDTGSGKTYALQQLGEMFGDELLPVTIADASNITGSGYQGGDICSIVKQHMVNCHFQENVPSILALDEIDKILVEDITSTGNDAGLAVQSEIMRILNPFPNELLNGRDRTTIILLGCFENVNENLSQKRDCKRKSIGFLRDDDNSCETNKDEFISELIKTGAKRELVGRIGNITFLEKLKASDYMEVLVNPRGILNKATSLFRMYGIEVEVSKRFLETVVAASFSTENFGIRGMEREVNSILSTETLFECISNNVKRIRLNGEKRIEYLSKKESVTV